MDISRRCAGKWGQRLIWERRWPHLKRLPRNGSCFRYFLAHNPERSSFSCPGDQLMTPTTMNEQIPVPPPAYHREQARLGPALHIDALTLVTTLHLLALCRFAVHVAHRRCPPPLPPGPPAPPPTYPHT